ncbi:thiol reductant ABC exporter subunit CydD [Microbacterium lacus]|uniref:thiol reductant ABC exporter subunit CydD n=1 Tax=Microbacterium lacus TaxID=415217 RepID=UPI00384BCFBA
MTSRSDATPRRGRRQAVDPRLLRYASASRGFFVAIAALALAQTAVIIAFAWLLTQALTGAIAGLPLDLLGPTLALLSGVVVLRAVLLWARDTVASRAAARVQAQLRAQLVEAVGTLGSEWLAGRNSSTLAITAGRGLDALDAYFGRYLPQFVQTMIATPVIIAVMWWQDWISGLTVLLTLPLIPIFMVLIGLGTQAVQQRQWKTLGHLAARFSDTVQGLSTLKVFGRHHRAVASIDDVTNRYRRETMRVLRVSFLSGFALEFLASISVAIIAVSIGFRLIDGSIALTVGLFVLLLAPEAYLPIRQVGVQFHAAAEGVAATEDVFSVLDATVPQSGARTGLPFDRPDDTPLPPLVLRGVRVARGERMLPPVDLVAPAGSVVLIEGPSGAGKSSVLAALRGAADFDGEATFGGRDLRTLRPREWLAWAGQAPGLTTGTIKDNITLGDTDPDSDLAQRALSLACAGGLDLAHQLGVQGAGLSGGQAQRVAVARAFYRYLRGRASVIALDEPSAALDSGTEESLWQSVRELADGGAAVVLVSHRASARAMADDVVTLTGMEVTA